MTNFKDSLSTGKKGEQFITKILIENGFTVYDESNLNRGGHDLHIVKDDIEYTVEVKNQKCVGTVNSICIEIGNSVNVRNNGLGWFYTCDADIIIFTNLDKYYYCFLDDLRKEFKTTSDILTKTIIRNGNEEKIVFIPIENLKCLSEGLYSGRKNTSKYLF